MDRRDGADTDCRALQSEAEPQLGVSIAASARAERTAPAVAGVSAKPRGGEALAGDGISDDPTPRTTRGCADLLRRRGGCAIGLPQRNNLGSARADAGGLEHGRTVRRESDLSGQCPGSVALHANLNFSNAVGSGWRTRPSSD